MNSSLRTFRESSRTGRGNIDPLQFVEGILATNLSAATGTTGKDANQSLTGRTTATLNVIAWDESDNFYLTGQTQEITNRSTTFSAGVGTYLCAYQIGGEFRPLPTYQTIRGRLMTTLASDDPIKWPAFGLMEVLGIGRAFGVTTANSSSDAVTITATTSTTFDVTTDITAFATSGRVLRVSGSGAVDGDYTITSSSYSAPSTTITVVAAVGTSTLTGSSSATVLGQFIIDGVPQCLVAGVSGDVTDLIHVGDALLLWGLTGTYTVVTRTYAGGTGLTTINVSETLVGSTVTNELAATTITAMDGNTITVTGDVRPECITGHVITVASSGSANGNYTIKHTAKSSTNTIITIEESSPTATIGGSSTVAVLRSLMQNAIHADDRLTYTISSMTTGALGTVTIPDPVLTLTSGDPIAGPDMFLEGHRVTISGSTDGVNDGVYRCRKAFLDNGSTITIYLDGTLATAATPGTITLDVPRPWCVKSKALAALRWYRTTIAAGSIIHTLPPDGDEFYDILGADIGPSLTPDPDDP